MAFRVKVEFEGLREALLRLDAIPRALKKKGLRKAVNEGTRILLWASKARVPKRDAATRSNVSYKGGQLRKSLGRKVKVYPSGVVAGIVGARQNFRIQVGELVRKGPKKSKKRGQVGDPIFVNPAKYLHLIELGTRRGVKPHHFLRDAMQANAAAVQSSMTATVDQTIQAAFAGGAS